jgi:predicted MPP superfamily phosphohydrolase
VLGNHDLWTDHARLESALRAGGAEVLVNRGLMLRPGVALIGLDEPWTGALDAPRALRGCEDAPVLIALCHSPDGLPDTVRALEALPRQPCGVFICGHTHGGQIATPWGPVVVPGRVGKRFPHGLYALEPLTLYVSCGVGATELPIRSFAPAEIAILDLVCAAA